MKKILIVEDDDMQLADLAIDLLAYYGQAIAIYPAPGLEGYKSPEGLLRGLRNNSELDDIIKAYDAETIDCVVADISLDNDEDELGLEFVGALRNSTGNLAKIPVIVWSVFMGQEAEAAMVNAEFIYKKIGGSDYGPARGAVVKRVGELLNITRSDPNQQNTGTD